MSKFVGKFRYDNDYSDDYDSTKSFIKTKKRKKENAEIRRMRIRQQQEDDYGYDDYVDKRRHAKL